MFDPPPARPTDQPWLRHAWRIAGDHARARWANNPDHRSRMALPLLLGLMLALLADLAPAPASELAALGAAACLARLLAAPAHSLLVGLQRAWTFRCWRRELDAQQGRDTAAI
jgi:hypothetical protein